MSTRRFVLSSLVGACAGLAAAGGAIAEDAPSGPRFVGFAPPLDLGVAGPPIDVDAGDVDGDGIADVVVAAAGSFGGALAIWIGQPDGTYVPQSSIVSLPNATTAIALADFDADGGLDLAVADPGGDAVRFHWGTGAGTFEASPTVLPVSGGPRELLVADSSGDGAPDLITLDEGGTSTLVRTDGSRSPWVQDVNGLPGDGVSMAAGDLDGDGDADLVVAVPGSQVLRVFRSVPAGLNWQTDLGGAGNVVSVSVGDLAGDPGLADVAAVTASGQLLTWESLGGLEMAGPGGRGLGVEPSAVRIADLDEDGDGDVLVTDGGFADEASRIRVLVQDPDGFADPMELDETERMVDVVLADLDGNTSLDFLGLVDDEEFRLVRTRINVTDVLPPGAFELAFPQNGQTGLPRPEDLVWEGATARLRWTEAAGFTVRYRVRIADNPELVDPAVDVDGIESLTWDVPPGSLSSSFTWYWSVEACNAAGFTTAAPTVSQFTMTCREDLDGDGTIGVGDVLQILTVWGTVCGG